MTHPSVEGGGKLHVRPVLFTAICAQLFCQVCHLVQLITGMAEADAFRWQLAHQVLARARKLPNLATEQPPQVQQVLYLCF